MSKGDSAMGQPFNAGPILGRWVCWWFAIGVSMFAAVFGTYVGMHLLDPDVARLGTNLNWELAQALTVGAITGGLLSPVAFIRRSRRLWWLGGLMLCLFLLFAFGDLVYLALTDPKFVATRPMIRHQVVFLFVVIPAFGLVMGIEKLLTRVFAWLD
jgi:hypothetical protein